MLTFRIIQNYDLKEVYAIILKLHIQVKRPVTVKKLRAMEDH